MTKVAVTFQLPIEYDAKTLRVALEQLQRAVNEAYDGVPEGRNLRAAAPTAGTWAQGTIVWNEAPAAAGTIGWVCTASGTPGTWKAWGSIAA